jgi:hypothetical protein
MSTRFSLKLSLSACALLGATSWALGQNAGANQSASGGVLKTQVSFLLVANAPALPTGAYIESGPKRVHLPVTANAVTKSELVPYDGPHSIVVFAGPPAGAVAPGAPVAHIELPKASQSLVLLAPGGGVPNAKGPPQYAALAVADDWESFPAGTVRVLNYCGKRAQAKISGQVVPLEKGPSRPAKVVEPGKGEVEFPFELVTSETDGPFVAYKNSIKIRPNQRVTIIALPRSGEGGRGISVVVTREVSAVRSAPGVKTAAPGGPPPPR